MDGRIADVPHKAHNGLVPPFAARGSPSERFVLTALLSEVLSGFESRYSIV